MSSVTPTATGNLGLTPLVNLAVYALDRQLTGTLVLEEPDQSRHAAYFEAGAPANVQVASPVAWLGQVLVLQGLLSEEEREPSYASARAKEQLHGQALISAGKISERQLRDALREQWSQKLLYLGGLSAETRYGYFDRTNLLEHWGGREMVRGRPLAVIWRLVKNCSEPSRISHVLERLGDRVLRLSVGAPVLRFHFERVEQAVIEVLRAKPQPYAELLKRDLAAPALIERLVYALAITRQFDLSIPGVEPLGMDEAPSSSRIAIAPTFTPPGGFPAPQVGSGRSGSVPARPATPAVAETPEVRAFKLELRARAQATEESHYEVLGVPRDASTAQVQAAYLALAKKWHPDRLGPECQDMRELATRVFARISEAQQVLTDTQQRREYTLNLRRAGVEATEAEHVQRVLRAATSFQKAEVLLKRNNLPQAELHARQALTDDPDQADHVALVAWIESQKPESDLKALIKDLDRAIQIQPNNLRAHWYRGQLYKRFGKNARAIQDFRFIIERDPRHTDALRELRLFQMRRTSSTGSSLPPRSLSVPPTPAPPQSSDKVKTESGGLINKLFKR